MVSDIWVSGGDNRRKKEKGKGKKYRKGLYVQQETNHFSFLLRRTIYILFGFGGLRFPFYFLLKIADYKEQK